MEDKFLLFVYLRYYKYTKKRIMQVLRVKKSTYYVYNRHFDNLSVDAQRILLEKVQDCYLEKKIVSKTVYYLTA